MKSKTQVKQQGRIARQRRVRKKVTGTVSKPRLCVFKSARYTYVQLVADDQHRVITGLSTRGLSVDGRSRGSVECAKVLGARIAEIAKEQKIESVVFDRNGYQYHGRVAAVAEGAREAGLIL